MATAAHASTGTEFDAAFELLLLDRRAEKLRLACSRGSQTLAADDGALGRGWGSRVDGLYASSTVQRSHSSMAASRELVVYTDQQQQQQQERCRRIAGGAAAASCPLPAKFRKFDCGLCVPAHRDNARLPAQAGGGRSGSLSLLEPVARSAQCKAALRGRAVAPGPGGWYREHIPGLIPDSHASTGGPAHPPRESIFLSGGPPRFPLIDGADAGSVATRDASTKRLLCAQHDAEEVSWAGSGSAALMPPMVGSGRETPQASLPHAAAQKIRRAKAKNAHTEWSGGRASSTNRCDVAPLTTDVSLVQELSRGAGRCDAERLLAERGIAGLMEVEERLRAVLRQSEKCIR